MDSNNKEGNKPYKFPKPTIRIFKHPDEQREEMYLYWASISPEQRMMHLKEMIIISFGLTPEKLANPGLINKITIVSYHK